MGLKGLDSHAWPHSPIARAFPPMALRFENDFLKKLEYLHVVSKQAFAGQNRADRLTPKRGQGSSSPIIARIPSATIFGTSIGKRTAAGPSAASTVRRRTRSADLSDARYQSIDGRAGEIRHGAAAGAALCYIGLVHLDRLTILPFGRGWATSRRRDAQRANLQGLRDARAPRGGGANGSA